MTGSASTFFLKPEKTTQLDTGAIYAAGPLRASASLFYAKHKDEADVDGYALDPATKRITRRAQQEKIANKVYANRIGNGDTASGDGWRFRGRGLIQLTGRANYASVSEKYKLLYPTSTMNLEASPERVKLVVYPGGHMFYSRDGARQAFRSEVEALMK